MEDLRQLAQRAQIPDEETDEVIGILDRDDGRKPNCGRTTEENEKMRQFRDKLVDANVLDTPI